MNGLSLTSFLGYLHGLRITVTVALEYSPPTWRKWRLPISRGTATAITE
ncbi:MAG: hypothetical protein HDR92_06015 [Bacteroides sp.]|nr:hypothetical protein [Bacteroides sp.]